jgi:hypothetical protein
MTDAPDAPQAETLPDRISADPKSPFYNKAALDRGVGIRFNGTEKTNVHEYCISEGWIRTTVGNTVDRKGQPMTMKFKGTVEAFVKLENGNPDG